MKNSCDFKELNVVLSTQKYISNSIPAINATITPWVLDQEMQVALIIISILT